MNTHNKQSKGKTWWSPVWRGLVVDPKGQHYRKMKNAVWLFLYFLSHADRKTGELWRKYATISSDMGIPIRTVRRWHERLIKHKYIAITHTGRSQAIHIQRWKPLRSSSKSANSGTASGQRRTA